MSCTSAKIVTDEILKLVEQLEAHGEVKTAQVLKLNASEVANSQSLTHRHFGAGAIPVTEFEMLLSSDRKRKVWTDCYYDDDDYSLFRKNSFLRTRCITGNLDPDYCFNQWVGTKEITGSTELKYEKLRDVEAIQKHFSSKARFATYNQEIATYNCIRIYIVEHTSFEIYLDLAQLDVKTFYTVFTASFKTQCSPTPSPSCMMKLSPHTKFYQAVKLQNSNLLKIADQDSNYSVTEILTAGQDSGNDITEVISSVPRQVQQALCTTSMVFVSGESYCGDPFEVCRLLQPSQFAQYEAT